MKKWPYIILIVIFAGFTLYKHGSQPVGQAVPIVDEKPPLETAPKEIPQLDINSIKLELDRVSLEKGEYVQVKRNGDIEDKTGKVTDDQLKSRLPADAEIIPYEGPKGKGYQIIIYNGDEFVSYGYGPEADERTGTGTLREAPKMTP